MYINSKEAEYFEMRLQRSLDMASGAVNPGAIMAHRGLAACYRSKLASLRRVHVPAPRNILSLSAFRDKRLSKAMSVGQAQPASVVSGTRF